MIFEVKEVLNFVFKRDINTLLKEIKLIEPKKCFYKSISVSLNCLIQETVNDLSFIEICGSSNDYDYI